MMLLFTILIVITSLLLVLIIMVQNPKGGGLGSSFGGGGSSQMFGGVKRTNDFLDRATWTLAIVLFALVLVINMTRTSEGVVEEGSKIQEKTESFSAPAVPQQTMPQEGAEMPIEIDEE